jgi:hypothetical protein
MRGSVRPVRLSEIIAVRSGNLELAQKMTQDVIEGALPQFYFHERG